MPSLKEYRALLQGDDFPRSGRVNDVMANASAMLGADLFGDDMGAELYGDDMMGADLYGDDMGAELYGDDMGFDWRRAAAGVATGGASELARRVMHKGQRGIALSPAEVKFVHAAFQHRAMLQNLVRRNVPVRRTAPLFPGPGNAGQPTQGRTFIGFTFSGPNPSYAQFDHTSGTFIVATADPQQVAKLDRLVIDPPIFTPGVTDTKNVWGILIQDIKIGQKSLLTSQAYISPSMFGPQVQDSMFSGVSATAGTKIFINLQLIGPAITDAQLALPISGFVKTVL